jgi:hypothetical protein
MFYVGIKYLIILDTIPMRVVLGKGAFASTPFTGILNSKEKPDLND